MGIRYDKKLEKEINRTIKNFNSKIKRLEKLDNVFIPNKITKKELKSNYDKRQDLKRKLKELQSFSKKGAEFYTRTDKGVVLSNFELENLKVYQKRLKQKISREINKISKRPVKIAGVEQNIINKMFDERVLIKEAIRKKVNKDINKLTKKELQDFKKFLINTLDDTGERKLKFINSFNEILNNVAQIYGYDKEKINTITQRLNNLSPEKFLDLYNDDRAIRNVLDFYPVASNNLNFLAIENTVDEAITLLDSLYENLDEIVKEYEK